MNALAATLILIALTPGCCAQEEVANRPKRMGVFEISLISLGASQIIDTVSSRHQIEMNPILGNGEFGSRQVATKSLIVGGAIIAQYLISRNHPRIKKGLTFVNFGTSGATLYVAGRNFSQ